MFFELSTSEVILSHLCENVVPLAAETHGVIYAILQQVLSSRVLE